MNMRTFDSAIFAQRSSRDPNNGMRFHKYGRIDIVEKAQA
jgi:hypothetical protein